MEISLSTISDNYTIWGLEAAKINNNFNSLRLFILDNNANIDLLRATAQSNKEVLDNKILIETQARIDSIGQLRDEVAYNLNNAIADVNTSISSVVYNANASLQNEVAVINNTISSTDSTLRSIINTNVNYLTYRIDQIENINASQWSAMTNLKNEVIAAEISAKESMNTAYSYMNLSDQYAGLSQNHMESARQYMDLAKVYRDQAEYFASLGSSGIQWGEKHSLTDPGELGNMSIDDDYMYICVKTGSAGQALWKKNLLFLNQ